LAVGYPDAEHELDMLFAQQIEHPLEKVVPVADTETWRRLITTVRQLGVERSMGQYIVAIIRATREDSRLQLGASPRAANMLFHASQGLAFVRGREFVLPDDIREIAPDVLGHRVAVDTKAQYSGTEKVQ